MWRALIIAAASFTISWQTIPPAENADGVQVYRATNAGIWGLIATIDVPDTFHVDSTAVFNRRYYYVVRSFRGDEYGPYSRVVVGTDFGYAGDPLVEYYYTGISDSVLYVIHLPATPWTIGYHDSGWYDALSITADVDVVPPFGIVNLSDFTFFGISMTDSTDVNDIINIYNQQSRYIPVFLK